MITQSLRTIFNPLYQYLPVVGRVLLRTVKLEDRTSGRKVPAALVGPLGAVLLAFGAATQAAHLPHVTDTVGDVHFNVADVVMPAFGGVPFLFPGGALTAGGPCVAAGGASASWDCAFADATAAPALANNWAWETGIHNPNAGIMVADIGFFFPGGPILGTLTLGAGSTFHIGVVIDDFVNFGEVGVYNIGYEWAGTVPIHMDAAVIEKTVGVFPGGALLNGDSWFHFHSSPDDSFVLNPALTVSDLEFSVSGAAVPVPAAVWLFGSGFAGLFAFARRKRRAAQ